MRLLLSLIRSSVIGMTGEHDQKCEDAQSLNDLCQPCLAQWQDWCETQDLTNLLELAELK